LKEQLLKFPFVCLITRVLHSVEVAELRQDALQESTDDVFPLPTCLQPDFVLSYGTQCRPSIGGKEPAAVVVTVVIEGYVLVVVMMTGGSAVLVVVDSAVLTQWHPVFDVPLTKRSVLI
jgi:hypothetical protein